MKTVTPVELRQSVSRVMKQLEKDGKPILITSRNKQVAAIVSMKDFEQKFVEKEAFEARKKIFDRMDQITRGSKVKKSGSEMLRELRKHG